MTMKIVRDTREQNGWTFIDQDIIVGTLDTGDYSLAGLGHLVAVERKELSDLVMCFTSERDRFAREMGRLRAYRYRAVIVEASMADILDHNYRSKAEPAAIVGSLASWTAKYETSFVLAGNRTGAQVFAFAYLKQVHRQLSDFAKTLLPAVDAN